MLPGYDAMLYNKYAKKLLDNTEVCNYTYWHIRSP